jgi:hypothetical protein
MNNGFKGSAIFRILEKSDPMQTKTVLEIERLGTPLGDDVPGDEASGSLGNLITWDYFAFGPEWDCWPYDVTTIGAGAGADCCTWMTSNAGEGTGPLTAGGVFNIQKDLTKDIAGTGQYDSCDWY